MLEKYLALRSMFKSGTGGGASSWNDLEDKPFGEEKAFEPIVWDGNTEGLETFELDSMGAKMVFYRISDHVPVQDVSQFDTITEFYASEQNEIISKNTRPASDDLVDGMFAGLFKIDENGWQFPISAVSSNGKECVDNPMLVAEPVIFPEGLWMYKVPSYDDQGTYYNFWGEVTSKTTVKTLDEKFMPTLTSPSGKKFKLTVDDSGAVTATEV